jgi:L-ascorbate metabolism protein UlaG (beta-lactamase superfamily)
MQGDSDAPSRVRVTYLGHASVVLEFEGESLVTDPVFSDRVGRIFTKRSAASNFRPEAHARVAGVLISHGHHDHLDYPSLSRLGRSLPILVPWGLAAPLRWHGYTGVRVVRPWESTPLGKWTVTAVPSRHFGGRLPFLYTSGYQGYVISGPTCVYFAGDTGLDPAMFREIGRRFTIDLAILPIAGALFPWFRRNHMNSEEAVQALHALGAKRMLPMHFETYPISFQAAEAPRRSLVQEIDRHGLLDRVTILADGESLTLEATRTDTASTAPRDGIPREAA